MVLPIGTYSLFYQPQDVEYYLTFDSSSQRQPTFSVFNPGAKSQQWEVSGDQSSSLRSVCSVSTGVCIGRSAANLNDTLTEPTPVPWYLAASTFGPGWYKFSANPDDVGPWWVVGTDPSTGDANSLILDSGGWYIFYFRPVQADVTSTGLPRSSGSQSLSTTVTSLSATQGSITASPTINLSYTAAQSLSSSISTASIPATVLPSSANVPAISSPPSSEGDSNMLSKGDIAGLASSIPLGVLGLIVGVWGLWYARKQREAGRPVFTTLINNIFHHHPSEAFH